MIKSELNLYTKMLSTISNTDRGSKRELAVDLDILAEKKRFKSENGTSMKNPHKENKDDTMIKGAWSPDEDKEMLKAVAKYGTDWKSIAKCVKGRTAKQCRDRYKLKLDPSINHGPWTPEEDQVLLNLHNQMGRQWTKIAKLMKGRTENSVKSRYASLMRSRTREWTEEEDRLLRQCREQDVSFDEISRVHLPHRSEHAVKKRWERLFMRDLARKIRSEMPSLKNSTEQQYKQKSPFPINPRLATNTSADSTSTVESVVGSQVKADQGNPDGVTQVLKYEDDSAVFSHPSAISPNYTAEVGEANVSADQNPVVLPQQQPPIVKSARQAKFKRHSTSVTVMMQLIGEPLNK